MDIEIFKEILVNKCVSRLREDREPTDYQSGAWLADELLCHTKECGLFTQQEWAEVNQRIVGEMV